MIGDNKIIAANLKGKNLFHVKYMRLSYRIRGSVARIHTNNVARTIVFIISWRSIKIGRVPVNSVTVSSLINKMFVYSAMKINANIPALYSTLNPDTSSDSPSAKSKGVRFVSARLVINHMTNKGKIINIIHVEWIIIFRSIDLWSIIADRIINAMDTSYEIVCATPRNAPRRAYLEFEHHPAINVVYTFILDTHKKYSTPYIKNEEGFECGYSVHSIKAKISPNTGANI